MNVIALIVCVDYDDFLKITLPKNSKFFDKYIIITSPKDTNTQKLFNSFQKKYTNIELIKTNDFYINNNPFNKGLALRNVQKSLPNNVFVSILDADIVLPNNFDVMIQRIRKSSKGCLWSAPRVHYDTFKDYQNNKPSKTQYDSLFQGYLQIYYNYGGGGNVNRKKLYPANKKNAGKSDNIFKKSWKSTNRIVLDCKVKHLGPSCVNWNGRISEKFI